MAPRITLKKSLITIGALLGLMGLSVLMVFFMVNPQALRPDQKTNAQGDLIAPVKIKDPQIVWGGNIEKLDDHNLRVTFWAPEYEDCLSYSATIKDAGPDLEVTVLSGSGTAWFAPDCSSSRIMDFNQGFEQRTLVYTSKESLGDRKLIPKLPPQYNPHTDRLENISDAGRLENLVTIPWTTTEIAEDGMYLKFNAETEPTCVRYIATVERNERELTIKLQAGYYTNAEKICPTGYEKPQPTVPRRMYLLNPGEVPEPFENYTIRDAYTAPN